MRKQIRAILLIAGTCIGCGMIALPMTMAKLGVIPSIVIMLSVWALTYYTSLMSVELNLQVEHGMSLGALGRFFSGKYAELIGTVSLKLLSYALLSVFIYAGVSIAQELIYSYSGYSYSKLLITTVSIVFIFLMLLSPIKTLSKVNSFMFAILISIFLILICVIIFSVEFTNIPFVVDSSFSTVIPVISVVFTSFGYQVVFHTLRDYCGRDAKIQKRIFLFGSLIPTIVYILWSCGILSVLYNYDISFYNAMIDGKIDVGDLISKLSQISGLPNFQILVWWLSIFAVLTSILGVGIGLVDSLNSMLKNKIKHYTKRNIVSALITVIPPYLIVVFVPNAFIKILGFAGAILVVIAIFLPSYLLRKVKQENFYCKELKHKWLIHICLIAGLLIIITEFLK